MAMENSTMKTYLMIAAVVLSFAVVVLAQQAATQRTQAATPGKPETNLVIVQDRDDVRMRGLERTCNELRAELEALKARVAVLEAAGQK